MFNISLVLISILRSTISDILSNFNSLTSIEFNDLHSIFKDSLVISSIPNYFNNSKTPIICYKYNKPIRSSIFNFNKIVNDIDKDSITPASRDCQISNYLYPSAGHVITGNLNVIPDVRVRNIISKGPIYGFPSNIDFSKCRKEITASLNDFSILWYKWENVEPDASQEWKINILKVLILIFLFTLLIHIFYPLNLNILFVILNEVSRIFI